MITVVDNIAAYEEALKASFVLVDFFTETCAPCKMFGKVLEQLAEQRPDLSILKVNLTSSNELADMNDIRAVPTVRIVKNGKTVDEWTGITQLDRLNEKIDRFI